MATQQERELIIKSLKGKLSAIEARMFEDWLAKPGNSKIYKEAEDLFRATLVSSSDLEFDHESAWKELEDRIGHRRLEKQNRRAKWFARITGAAALALLMVFGWQKMHVGECPTTTFSNISGRSRVTLPDGSTAWLQSTSAISYQDVRNNDRREVSMTGHACFKVARNPERPFVVNIDGLSIEVLGTTFDVFSQDNFVNIALAEGSITAYSTLADKSVTMHPGEVIRYERSTGEFEMTGKDAGQYLLWTNKKLRFEGATIKKVADDLSHWYNIPVVLDDSVEDCGLFSFTVTDEPVDMVMYLICKVHPISYEYLQDRTIVIKSK